MTFFNIKRTFKTARERNWDKVFVFIDLHDTICPASYESGKNHSEFYPMAKEALQHLSDRKDVCLVLWTCSFEKELNPTMEWFKENNINFEHINLNPEVKNTRFGNFKQKQYMNIIFDDKAGFEGDVDWPKVLKLFKQESELEVR